MNKSNNLYKKALALFENGKIDRAIEVCEKSIAEDARNKAAMNLKGMIFYFKGDLEEAKKVWKLNCKINKDKVTEKYLNGIENDEKLFNYFLKALKCMEKLKISEALELLKKCEESDYNCINVSNNIAICNVKLGDYEKANIYLEKVLKLDKYNETAVETKKQLENIGVIKSKFHFKSLLKPIAAVLILFIIIGSVYVYNKNFKNARKVSMKNEKKVTVKKKLKSVPKKQIKVQNKFNAAELENAINNKDYDKIVYYEETFKDKDVRINDEAILNKALEVLKNDGVLYFYTTGCSYVKKGDYANAKLYFLKAYNYGSSSYLYKDIIYFIGTTYKNLGDIENEIKYYEMYDSNYKTGSYEETVLYELAVAYKDIDKGKAKSYANSLEQHYPTSIYNNSVIKSIISN